MKFVLERLSGPAIEVVTVAEMKRHLGEFASVTDRDTDIEGLIKSAREWVETFTGRALVDQQWRLTVGEQTSWDSWPPPQAIRGPGYFIGDTRLDRGALYLRKSPALAIVSVATLDDAGESTTMDAASYALREEFSKWPRIVLLNGGTWATGITQITFRAGFADRTGSPQQDASVVPERFKQAIKLHVEAMYDRDSNMMQKLLDTAETLIRPERCELGLA